jgi:hypothetical protein
MNYLDDIQAMIEGVDFGDVMVTVKRHTKKTHQVIVHAYESHKPRDNAQAAAIIMQIIKDAYENKFSGSVSFTVVFNKGKVSRLIKQDNTQLDYKDIDGKSK